MDKGSIEQWQLEDSGGWLFPAVEGNSLEKNKTGIWLCQWEDNFGRQVGVPSRSSLLPLEENNALLEITRVPFFPMFTVHRV